ncbi:glycosyltransferase [Microbacterium sp. 69-7]|uniref:glycosyltransferase n=1 Tax=Microbacterium sp. 69-7 TaxID=1895784 RepID=UPI000B1D46ED|nr:glycosyltransferase [Microbacterium sp. 69-7]
MPITLSVVVTSHGEGRLLRPTLRSVAAAIERLIAEGESAELVIICDNADAPTRHEATRFAESAPSMFSVRVEHVSLGESGAARNFAAHNALGEFIAYVDGDDLVSSNYFADSVALLRESDHPIVLHPELVMSFGARSLLWRTESTRTHEIDYRDLIRRNLWPASCVTLRSVLVSIPYRSLAPEAGYGPEDWLWNIDTSAAGVVHDVAPNTVFFYRVRESGGVNNRHAASLLPPFDLDGLKLALPRVDRAEPSTDSAPAPVTHRLYRTMLPFVRRATWWLSWEAKHVLYRGARAIARSVPGWRRPRLAPTIERVSTEVRQALREATRLEPAISWTATALLSLESWQARDDGYGDILVGTLDRLRDANGALVIVPWVGIGGADTVSLNYAQALAATDRFQGRTTMLGTFLAEKTVHERIPGTIQYSHLDERWLTLLPHVRDRLIAQLIVLLRPELVVCVNSFHFVQALRKYAHQITDGTRVFATLFSFDKIGDDYPTNPITDDSQRRFLDEIDALLTDNSRTAATITETLALDHRSVIVHRQPTSHSTPQLPRATRAYHDEHFSHENPFRILWPHRLDGEKRPDVLPKLAHELKRRGLPVRIEAWGSIVLGGAGNEIMSQFRESGVVYQGSYTGGLPTLDTYSYHALLLTSQNEGLPLVLVESLLRGLPVVASGVGGVVDIIRNEQTGLITAGPDDINGFANAVERLMKDLTLRRSLIETGYSFAVEHHSWQSFVNAVERDLLGGLT